MESSGRPRRRQMPTLPTRPPKQFYAYASSNAISNLMVRSAATPRVSNHEATGLAAILRDGASRLLRMRSLQLCIIDRLVSIERAVYLRQRIFKACGAIEQHHAVIFI